MVDVVINHLVSSHGSNVPYVWPATNHHRVQHVVGYGLQPPHHEVHETPPQNKKFKLGYYVDGLYWGHSYQSARHESFNFSEEHFQYSFAMLDLEVARHSDNCMEKLVLHGTFKDKRHIKRIVVKKKCMKVLSSKWTSSNVRAIIADGDNRQHKTMRMVCSILKLYRPNNACGLT